MEEGTELLHRLEAKAAERAGAPLPHEHASTILPMFTSCCPGAARVARAGGAGGRGPAVGLEVGRAWWWVLVAG